MSITEYILLFLSVVVGGGVAFYLKKNNKEILSLILSFSGAYILGITVLHLMPGIFHDADSKQGLFILLGFSIQLILEQFSGGVEHGHTHANQGAGLGFAISIMVGLCVHAFMEGMPLGNYENFHTHTHGHEPGHNHLLLGIILHKAPAAFALVLILLMSGFKKNTVWFCLLIFALMSPLGGLLGEIAQFSQTTWQIIVAIVVGSFLHISTTIIFEADGGSHKILKKKLAAIIGGMSIALLTLIL